jgi:Papain-like cysteine protease AvrRpt2
MQRREFLSRMSAVAASTLLCTSSAIADQTCDSLSPIISRCTASIASGMFHIEAHQRSREWCWAACIEMIFRHYGYQVPQARIVRETWGTIVDMPAFPRQIMANLNREWEDEDHGRFRSFGDTSTANVSNTVDDLTHNRPLIIGALWHAVVLTALTTDINKYANEWDVVSAAVCDPWPGIGKRNLSATEWHNLSFAARVVVLGDRS